MWGSAMIVGVWEGEVGVGRKGGGGREGGGREGVLWSHALCIGCHLDTEYNTPTHQTPPVSIETPTPLITWGEIPCEIIIINKLHSIMESFLLFLLSPPFFFIASVIPKASILRLNRFNLTGGQSSVFVGEILLL